MQLSKALLLSFQLIENSLKSNIVGEENAFLSSRDTDLKLSCGNVRLPKLSLMLSFLHLSEKFICDAGILLAIAIHRVCLMDFCL